MSLPVAQPHLSYTDYLALERALDARHEYLNGEAWMMTGGTIRHSAVKTNLTGIAFSALRGRPCRPYDSDLKVRVLDSGLTTYPDLAVVCGPPAVHPEDPHALTNPTLLAEVLSESTEAWDRGGKFAHYRRIPTLRYYLLINVRPSLIELFTRMDDGSWRLTEHGPGSSVSLPEIGVVIPVDEVYRDLPEEAVAGAASPAEG